ncbi:hypothetical protein [Deinococcus sp. QL22]|uniref:hypothetical protein n=1 Tax=Deinococcus sp. QL22 TaxID=2939437 RepID=UPI002018200B|nr:hypothetical protein [Deinococcus sp. QL22]UQN09567.1 hypothetical protein M1R55_25815 [Deinococcus sp. QL22]
MNSKNFGVNLMITYGSNIFLGVLGVIFVPIALRKLGLEGFGVFALYTTILSAIALIDLGIGRNLSRNLATCESVDVGQNVVSLVIALYSIIVAFIVLISPIIALVVPKLVFGTIEYVDVLGVITYIAIFEYILSIPCNIYISTAVAREKFSLLATYNNISGLLKYSVMFLALFIFKDPLLLIIAVSMRKIIDIVIARLILGKIEHYNWKPVFSYVPLRVFAVQSFNYSIPQLLQTMVILSSSFSVGSTFGLVGLGVYRSAFDIANRIWFFSNGLGLVVFPRLVKLNNSNEGRQQIKRLLPMQMLLSWMLYLSIAIVVIVYGNQILPSIGISDYQIISMIKLLVLGVSLNAHANLAYEVLQSRTDFVRLNIVCVLSLVLLLGVYFAFKDHIGVLSIGWAWVISQSFYAFILDEFAQRGHWQIYLLKASLLLVTIYSLISLPSESYMALSLYAVLGFAAFCVAIKLFRRNLV